MRYWWRSDVILQRTNDGTPEDVSDSDSDSEVGDDEI